ncbi:hypothetical protein BU197_01850 [Streptomyces sp. CBMA291]|nr:hypothetical protein [Streptomyces sp. CBMA291]MBD0713692.1 hypothetical protein [Streptomyces sp. CBMA370]
MYGARSRGGDRLVRGALVAVALAGLGLTAVPASAVGPERVAGRAGSGVASGAKAGAASGAYGTGDARSIASTRYDTGVDTPAEARLVEQVHGEGGRADARLTAALPEGHVVSRTVGTARMGGPAGSVAPAAPAPGGAASHQTATGGATSRQATSGEATSRQATSGEAASRQAPSEGAASRQPVTKQSASRAWAQGLSPSQIQGIEREFAPEIAADTALIRTVGKVEYVDPRFPKETQWCSAASINSPSKMMVATAGHCVAVGGSGNGGPPDDDRIWMQGWVFIPAYNTGGQLAPYGKFTAKSFLTFDYWVDGGGTPYDFALVTVNRNAAGQRVVDAVGGNGMSWNYTDEEDLLIAGYPLWYDSGYTQYQFAGRTKTSSLQSANIMMEGAGFDGGGSGGPWLRAYNPATGLGNINGVTSYIHNGSSNNNDSPYFDAGMKRLWDLQGSVT